MNKRKFALVSDSATDMPEAYFKEHEIELVKLGYQINGKVYGGSEEADLSNEEFYQMMREGAMPTTYQVTAEQARPHIEKYLKAGTDVLVVAFSSGLSGTAGSFAVAAKELGKAYPDRKVLVIDSLCASMGEGLFLDYIVKKADTGATLEETYEYGENLKLHICHYFTADDLFHLKRGGRISASTAIVGSLLKIKPVMHVDNAGHLIPIGKAMGRKRSIRDLAEHMAELQTLQEGDPVFISHSACEEEANGLAAYIKERFGVKQVLVNYIGPVIGSHTGIGTIALFFVGKNR